MIADCKWWRTAVCRVLLQMLWTHITRWRWPGCAIVPDKVKYSRCAMPCLYWCQVWVCWNTAYFQLLFISSLELLQSGVCHYLSLHMKIACTLVSVFVKFSADDPFRIYVFLHLYPVNILWAYSSLSMWGQAQKRICLLYFTAFICDAFDVGVWLSLFSIL